MTSARPRVVLALTPLAERQLEGLLFDTDAPLELIRSVAEADELLRTVQEQPPDAVLVSPGLSGLTAAHCERVRALGVRLVGLALDERERETLGALGVDASVDPSLSREELIAAVRSTGQRNVQVPAVAPVTSRPEHAERRGSVLAVIGCKGAPGSSELAASLAGLAAARWETVLVELDALGGALDIRLGADPGHGSIVGLLRAVQAGEGALGELIERWVIEGDGWPSVLLGPPDPQTLTESAQPGAVARALDALATLYPLVVCDIGFALSGHEQIPTAARIHREALLGADAVLLVLGARDAQLRDGARQLQTILGRLALPAERLRILVNGLGAPSSSHRETIVLTLADPLAEHGVSVDAWLSWDARGARRAQRQGKPLALARPRGAYARALLGLLDELFLPDVPGANPKARRRKRRLAAPSLPRRAQHEQQEEREEVALPWQS